MQTERIEETTVGDIDGWMITVANVMAGQWNDANGQVRTGLSVEVGLYDEDRTPVSEVTVGAGAALEIAGRPWTVVAVTEGIPLAGERMSNGHVTLQRAK
ncbi:MAG: hypothetical protein KC502_09520 [Myxococcales bacterium]|nr:hypothetical protein [Myxococcales bacterium]